MQNSYNAKQKRIWACFCSYYLVSNYSVVLQSWLKNKIISMEMQYNFFGLLYKCLRHTVQMNAVVKSLIFWQMFNFLTSSNFKGFKYKSLLHIFGWVGGWGVRQSHSLYSLLLSKNSPKKLLHSMATWVKLQLTWQGCSTTLSSGTIMDSWR